MTTTIPPHADPDAADVPADDSRAAAPQIDRPRRVRKSRVIAGVVVTAAVAVAAGWMLSWSSPVPVRAVVVTGADDDTTSTIASVVAASGVAQGTPLRDIDRDSVLTAVSGVQGIDAAELVLDRPWTVQVAVTQRQPVAAVRTDATWNLVDIDGVPVRQSVKRPNTTPPIVGPQEQWPRLAQVARSLPPEVAAQVAQVGLADTANAGDTGSSAAAGDPGITGATGATGASGATAAGGATGATGAPENAGNPAITLTLTNDAVVSWGDSSDNELKAAVLASLLRYRASSYNVVTPQRPALGSDARLPKRNQSAPVPSQ